MSEQEKCPKCGSDINVVIEDTDYCLGCDGAGSWIEHGVPHTCSVCNGAGVHKKVSTLAHGIDSALCLSNQLQQSQAREAELQQQLAAKTAECEYANQVIAGYGGYHEQTEREIEIRAALDDIPLNERDSWDVAIGELLAIIDAGRCRLGVCEAQYDQLQQRVAELEKSVTAEIRVQQAFVDSPVTLGREWHKYHEGHVKALQWALWLIQQKASE